MSASLDWPFGRWCFIVLCMPFESAIGFSLLRFIRVIFALCVGLPIEQGVVNDIFLKQDFHAVSIMSDLKPEISLLMDR
jgi:hypothetical protein